MSEVRIAIVEDDADLGEAFADAFSLSGYKTLLIQNGLVALEQIRAFRPHVITLDLHLPKISGVDILQAIRADADLADTKIVVVSADPIATRAVEHLADIVMLKPVAFEDLFTLSSRLHAMS